MLVVWGLARSGCLRGAAAFGVSAGSRAVHRELSGAARQCSAEAGDTAGHARARRTSACRAGRFTRGAISSARLHY